MAFPQAEKLNMRVTADRIHKGQICEASVGRIKRLRKLIKVDTNPSSMRSSAKLPPQSRFDPIKVLYPQN